MIRSAIIAVLLFSTVVLAQQAPLAGSPVEQARRVVDLLLQEKYAEVVAMFAPEVKKALPEEKLRTNVQPVFQSIGAVRQRLEPRTQTAGEQQTVVLPVEFEKVTLEFVVSTNKAGEIIGLWMRPAAAASAPYQPPTYSKPGSFRSEEVTIGKGEWQLPGTLTLPAGKGPFAAVVLVHGSGPNDRDESVGASKPFRDLAEGLSSRGIAVLRYEKRTRQLAAKMVASRDTLTVQQETIDDALAAADFLRNRAEIAPARVFVPGHSLGGYLITRIGRQDPKLAGLIALAGATRPMEDLIVEQTSYLASLKGELTAAEQEQVEKIKAGAQRVKTLKAENQVPASELPLGVPQAYWLDLKGYDPAVEARSLKQPMLILQGERDYQVTMADFARWKEALKGRPNVKLRSFPALNHLFETGEGKSTPDEYVKPSHVAPEVIDEIVNWVSKIGG